MMFNAALAQAAPDYVRTISFEGNEVTEESLLRQQMFITEGDEMDIKKVERSVQAIMDLGLFSDVSYYLAEDYLASDAEAHAVDLVILLEEKFYLFVLPRVRIDDDELHLGLQLHWDNIAGLNHSMRLLVEDRGSKQGVQETRQRFSYEYPNVNGSAYSMGVLADKTNTVDENEIDAVIDRRDSRLGMDVTRWLNADGRTQGWFIGFGGELRQRENRVISGSLNSETLDAVLLRFDYGYSVVHEYAYNRGGKEFGYDLEVSDDRFGSNTEYVRHLLYYRSYYRFKSRPGDNLNVQTLFGHATADILGDAAFSLGSSADLRGFDNNRYEGNTLILVNMEYLTPTDFHKPLRYVVFMDVGSVYDSFREIRHENLKTGVGFGIRWKIPRFVKLDLRVDVGYAINDEDYHISFGARHAF